MEILKFENQYMLWLLLLVPFMIFTWALVTRAKNRKLSAFGDSRLLETLVPLRSKRLSNLKFALYLIAFTLVIIALANPQIGSKMEKSKRVGSDIIIAIDISNSMLAEDIQPNRLTRAKMAINNLVNKLEGDRLGIIVFAGQAYTQLPVTSDYGAAKMFLNTVSTDFINTQGTSISAAIDLATESFKAIHKEKKDKSKALIIITDGEDHEEGALESAKTASEDGIAIYTIGMGLEKGGPIPVYSNGRKVGHKKDKDGITVITKLNEQILVQIAKAGNGVYTRASNSNVGLNEIFTQINKLDKQDIETRSFKDYTSWFQIFVGLAIFFLLLDLLIPERRNRNFRFDNLFKPTRN